MKSVLFSSFAASALLLGAGCSSPSVQYKDATEAHSYSRNFTAYDYQQAAAAMVDSMLSNPNFLANLAEQFEGKRPVISVKPISNQTYQMGLNLDSLNDSIRTRVINSGRFRMVGNRAAVEKELFDDEESVLTNKNQVKGFGNASVADYVLSGTLVEMRDGDSRTKESYYKLTMQLDNKVTGETDWIAEKEIRKETRRRSVGF